MLRRIQGERRERLEHETEENQEDEEHATEAPETKSTDEGAALGVKHFDGSSVPDTGRR